MYANNSVAESAAVAFNEISKATRAAAIAASDISPKTRESTAAAFVCTGPARSEGNNDSHLQTPV
jgi:hypothetical protein